jgi:hypothetical protein
MLPVPIAPHLRALAPDFARRFALIAAGLAATIARAFLRNPRLAPLIIPLCARLTRSIRRCAGLMASLAAGKHPRRAAKRSGEASDRGALAPRKRSTPRIPTAEAWLIQTLRHEAAAYASQLAHLLAEPAAVELLAAAPTTDHFLRPICRLLGIRREAQRSGDESGRGARPTAKRPRGQAPRERGREAQRSGASSRPESVLPSQPHAPQPPPRPTPRPSRAFADDLPWITLPLAKRA